MEPDGGVVPQACTIIARNYLAYARVLATSFLRHHPGGRFSVVLVDAQPGDTRPDEPFRVLHLADMGMPVEERHRMSAIYDVTELATAVKPVVLRHLVAECGGPVIYLDPDIEVHSGFPEVSTLAAEHGIVLTPHVLEPMPRDGLYPNESQILISGIYNLGFIAVGPQAVPFLDWWAERLRRDAVIDPCRGLFTDQRWIDFVPVLFDHHVLRSPAYNVAYWNVFARPITAVDGRYEVEGEPLRFFHFSGFDPHHPNLLSKHQADRPRTLLSRSPVVAALCRDYADRLFEFGHQEACRHPYGLNTLVNGLHLDTTIRRLYRTALEAGPEAGGPPPDPFEPGGADEFVAWLRAPTPTGPGRGRVSRYLAAYWATRPDLQAEFPGLTGEAVDRYLQWAELDPSLDQLVQSPLRTTSRLATAGTPRRPPPQANGDGPLVPGVTIAGYFRAEVGVGEAGRLLVAGLEATGMPFATTTYDRTLSSLQHPFHARGGGHRFDVNIMCVNADMTPVFVREMGERFTRGTYDIGLWFWEVEHFPASLHGAYEHVDEIWVASEFTREAIGRFTRKPVHVVPLPALVPSRPTNFTRADLGLSEDFLFLFAFDFFSVVQRKNPSDVIEAFSRAFAPGEGASLVIKTINGTADVRGLENLRSEAARHPDVHILDARLPAARMRALTGVADCVVSLHRSEGFGLTLLEAMGMAKPVIATGYSGNLAFMDDENSFLVPYDLVPIGPDSPPYPAEARWAQPRVEEAARLMRHVFDDRAAGQAVGRHAQRVLSERHGVERTAAFIVDRLERIRGGTVAPRLVGASA